MKTLRSRRVMLLFGLVLFALALSPAWAQSDDPLTQPVKRLVPEVVSVRPHDPTAWTQGLIYYDGALYESTGAHGGPSTLREVDPATGEVRRSIELPEEYFAEGLERVDDKLIQLTWQSHVAFVYDLATFEQVGTFDYEGEGWGLCSDGAHLYMSDGTSFLTLRDPQTFAPIFSGSVTLQGTPVNQVSVQDTQFGRLNELECAGDYVYANVWYFDYILQIDKTNGVVAGLIDASSLFASDSDTPRDSNQVLNGIAYLPDSDTFLLTGKLWPHMYEVRFVEQEQPAQ